MTKRESDARLRGYKSGSVRRKRRDQRMGECRIMAQEMYDDGRSLTEIAASLNRRNMVTSRGCKFWPATVWRLLHDKNA